MKVRGAWGLWLTINHHWFGKWRGRKLAISHYHNQWWLSVEASPIINSLRPIDASVNWINISSDNGLSPGWHQAIIWTNAGILFLEPVETNFSEILIEIHTFSCKKMHLKMSSGVWQTFYLGLNVLRKIIYSACTRILLRRIVQHNLLHDLDSLVMCKSSTSVENLNNTLTHWGLLMPYGDIDLGQDWLR